MSNETQHIPADVRERVDVPGVPDGGNDATTCPGCGLPNWSGLCAHCRGDQDEYERELVPPFPTSRPDEESAALRSDAQGDDHWEDLVFGPITEAYNEAHAARRSDAQREEDDKPYAYIGVEETWDADSRSVTVYERVLWDRDSATRWQAERPEDRTVTPVYHRPAACRGEAPGDGPVGAVCANCGDPNAKIAGGELDPDEAVCSVECYEQLRELGCPQEHGGTYRPKPARRGEGGGE